MSDGEAQVSALDDSGQMVRVLFIIVFVVSSVC